MGTLDNKVALISGASRGQGEAEARLFAREGASVVLADILDDEGARVAASIEDTGGRATYVHLDVTSEAEWARAVQTAQATYGSLSTLINNAGILYSASLEEMPLDEYMRVIQVNQVGVLLGIQAAIPALKAAGGGSIVNTSSTAGLEGYPGMAAYVSSKWAVRGLTKVAALELGPYGIRVNSVHPGPIDTPMINPTGADMAATGLTESVPLRRVGDAEEVDALMLFLASDASSYCSGGEFKVDGGLTAGRSLG